MNCTYNMFQGPDFMEMVPLRGFTLGTSKLNNNAKGRGVVKSAHILLHPCTSGG
jgi:hypothetical protein